MIQTILPEFVAYPQHLHALAVVFHGIRRGFPLQWAVGREGTTGDHQPLLRSRAFPFEARLHTASDHLNPHWTFLTVAHRQACPRTRSERLSPGTHRLPGGFR